METGKGSLMKSLLAKSN